MHSSILIANIVVYRYIAVIFFRSIFIRHLKTSIIHYDSLSITRVCGKTIPQGDMTLMLMDQGRDVLRKKHYSIRKEHAYMDCGWTTPGSDPNIKQIAEC